MKRTILAVSVSLGFLPSAAFAVDWSVQSSISESVELNDNQFLRRMLAGGTLGSYTTITANAEALTPTSKFYFDSDVSYQKYWGPGTEGIRTTETRSDGFKAHYETSGKDRTDRNYIEASWREQSTALALLNEFGVGTSATGFLDTTTVAGGIERSLTFSDFVALSARSTYTNYDPSGGGTPYTDTSAAATWRHRFNSVVALTASSEIEWLDYNNTQNTNVIILRDTAGVDATLSPLLSFRGSGGVAYVKTDRGSAGFSLVPSPSGVSSNSSGVADFITDMLLTYRMLKSTTVTLAGTQTIAPSIIGSLLKRTTIRTGLIHTVNTRSTISISADATRQTGAGTSADYLSASISWSYLLAREWSAQLSYRYLHLIPGTTAASSSAIVDPITGLPTVALPTNGPTSSNSVLLVLSHNFTILPAGQ